MPYIILSSGAYTYSPTPPYTILGVSVFVLLPIVFAAITFAGALWNAKSCIGVIEPVMAVLLCMVFVEMAFYSWSLLPENYSNPFDDIGYYTSAGKVGSAEIVADKYGRKYQKVQSHDGKTKFSYIRNGSSQTR